MKKNILLVLVIFLCLACRPTTEPTPATPTLPPAQDTATPTPPRPTKTPQPQPTETEPVEPQPTEEIEPLSPLDRLSSWTAWLEADLPPKTVAAIAASDADLVVLDFIPSRVDSSDYPMAEVVARLHQADPPKLVLAYLNIGQAEKDRTYWQPDWSPGDPWWLIESGTGKRLPVGYWNDRYRDIWLAESGYLQAILEAGFDGLYLDGLEAYADEAVVAFAAEDGADPAQEMLWLVGDIAEFARSQQPEFIIIGHNGAGLVNSEQGAFLLEILDGLAQEELWAETKGAAPSADEALLEILTQIHNEGKSVFTIDYTRESKRADRITAAAQKLGFLPLIADQPVGRYGRQEEEEEAVIAAGEEPIVTTPTPLPPRLATVNDFLYQLQEIDLEAVGQTAYDLVVMDYAAEGNDDTAFNPDQIAALQDSPGGSKIVLAYMSIGEAETYRFYWNGRWDADQDGRPDVEAPPWLDVENPYWPGNYKVRYWEPAWQAIIFDYTDRLLAAGFDGVYLDIIDAYTYYEDQGRTTAAREMADFVAAIAAHARSRDPDFYLFPQNAAGLVALVPDYLNSISGIGHEEVYYGYEGDDQPTPPHVTAGLEDYLDLYQKAGKLVLTIEYATTPTHIDDAYARARAKGYVPFVTGRNLDELTINAGHEPD